MNGQDRREAIAERLRTGDGPISAGRLAEAFGVTRQIVVADVALLRAAGYPIVSVSKGYVWEADRRGLIKRVAVKHGQEAVAEELYAVVDHGGRVLDVVIEHPVYGRMSVELDISSRYDVDRFLLRVAETGANPLSLLTEGVHIHTLSVRDEETFARITARLSELGVLIESM